MVGNGFWRHRLLAAAERLAPSRLRPLHGSGTSGLPYNAIERDFDPLYVELLVKCVRESWLNAVVILAHERVYDEDGKLLENLGSFPRAQRITC